MCIIKRRGVELEKERGRGEEARKRCEREMRGKRRGGKEMANVAEKGKERQGERKVGDWKKEREKKTRKSEGVTIRSEVERQGGRWKMWNRT